MTAISLNTGKNLEFAIEENLRVFLLGQPAGAERSSVFESARNGRGYQDQNV
jgi:hypothetical protein